MAGEAVGTRDGEGVACPVDKGQRVQMGEHNTLGSTCGSRCKKNVGEVLVGNVDYGRRNWLARQRISEGNRRRRERRIGAFIDEEYGCHRTFIKNSGAEFLTKRKTRDQRAETALPRDFREAQAGSIWIDRNVTRTGFHNSKYTGDCGRRFVKINPYAITGNDSAFDERV